MAGHLFLVHGKIEELTHDAALVPVAGSMHFNKIWKPLLGRWPSAPSTWSDGWGRIAGTEQWLVQVADGEYRRVLERLSRAARDVASRALQPLGDRGRPLVALPVLGIGHGGHRHEQGRVLKLLVDHLTELAESTDLDFALVTPDASVFAAAQYIRRGTHEPSEEVDRVARDLGQRARNDELALFIGAGASMPAGLPSWSELIRQLAVGVPGAESEAFHALGATDQAELIQETAGEALKQQVADIVSAAPRPALIHGLLAGLGVRNTVTTNYDRFYERAVMASGRTMESVLPWASAVGSERWALKLHGDVEHPKSIVLTRRHMLTYDAQNRPSAALLQSVLLTKHLLVIGTSLTDDNVLRLAYEVQAYRVHHRPKSKETFGTQLDASAEGDRLRARLWEGQLDWVCLADLGVESPRRALELVLDRAGMYSTKDASWLLDERFAGLLADQADRELASQARELVEVARRRDLDTWGPLVDCLDQLGAAHKRANAPLIGTDTAATSEDSVTRCVRTLKG